MAKYELTVKGTVRELKNYILRHEAMLGDTAEIVDESEGEMGGSRYWFANYERYAMLGENRVSMCIMLLGGEDSVRVVASASGGSQAVVVKINTISEENFLDAFMELMESYEASKKPEQKADPAEPREGAAANTKETADRAEPLEEEAARAAVRERREDLKKRKEALVFLYVIGAIVFLMIFIGIATNGMDGDFEDEDYEDHEEPVEDEIDLPVAYSVGDDYVFLTSDGEANYYIDLESEESKQIFIGTGELERSLEDYKKTGKTYTTEKGYEFQVSLLEKKNTAGPEDEDDEDDEELLDVVATGKVGGSSVYAAYSEDGRGTEKEERVLKDLLDTVEKKK